MTTIVIDERDGVKEIDTHEVEDGQVRTNECGRIILVITDVRFPKVGRQIRTETIRAVILKEMTRCNGGKGVPFQSIPREYTREELAKAYPIVLESSFVIHGEAR